jgi:hypothetical protein
MRKDSNCKLRAERALDHGPPSVVQGPAVGLAMPEGPARRGLAPKRMPYNPGGGGRRLPKERARPTCRTLGNCSDGQPAVLTRTRARNDMLRLSPLVNLNATHLLPPRLVHSDHGRSRPRLVRPRKPSQQAHDEIRTHPAVLHKSSRDGFRFSPAHCWLSLL